MPDFGCEADLCLLDLGSPTHQRLYTTDSTRLWSMALPSRRLAAAREPEEPRPDGLTRLAPNRPVVPIALPLAARTTHSQIPPPDSRHSRSSRPQTLPKIHAPPAVTVPVEPRTNIVRLCSLSLYRRQHHFPHCRNISERARQTPSGIDQGLSDHPPHRRTDSGSPPPAPDRAASVGRAVDQSPEHYRALCLGLLFFWVRPCAAPSGSLWQALRST